MSWEGIIIGLLAIGIGLAWAFYGLKLFTILLPLWAFFFGLVAGAQWGADIFGQGFFATVLSWGIGLVFGLVLAAISFFWYYAAIVTVATFALGVPILLVMVFSAFSGAAAVVNGVLIFLGQIKLDDLHQGIFGSLLSNGLIGVIAFVVLGAAALFWQIRDVGTSITSIDRSSYRY